MDFINCTSLDKKIEPSKFTYNGVAVVIKSYQNVRHNNTSKKFVSKVRSIGLDEKRCKFVIENHIRLCMIE